MIYSFDVFDTCFCRVFIRPIDLFYELGRRVFNTFDLDITEASVKQFANQRIKAENKARKLSTKNDITLDEIYIQFKMISNINLDFDKVKSSELQLEFDSLIPIWKIQQSIKELRACGSQIAFISDMYLPRGFIKKCLMHHGFFQNEDLLYVSGELGINKASGKLFSYFLKKHNIDNKDLVHTGDNYHSDVYQPRKLGISSNFYNDSHLSLLETSWYKYSDFTSKGNIASKIGGIAKATRLSCPNDNHLNDHLLDIITGTAAPLLVSFVAWVLYKAKKEDIKRLYFVARDGQILFKIAEQLLSKEDTIECKYIYGSRQAWLLPSIDGVSKEKLSWLFNTQEDKSFIACLTILGINIDDILSKKEKADVHELINLKDCTKADDFWNFINRPNIRKKILENAKQNRIMALKYFEQEGMFEGTSWAIVDSGLFLNCQKALRNILISKNSDVLPKGYYLALAIDHLPINETGPASGFIDQSKAIHHWMFRFGIIPIIETVFLSANHATLLGYRNDRGYIFPIFKKTVNNYDLTNEIHNVILTYTKYFGKLSSNILISDLEEVISEVTKQFFEKPSKYHVDCINSFSIISAQSHSNKDQYTLGTPLSMISLLSKKIFNKNSLPQPWMAGSIVHSNIMIRGLYNLKRMIRGIY
jgi:predicted HAD superfamily hydrolase